MAIKVIFTATKFLVCGSSITGLATSTVQTWNQRFTKYLRNKYYLLLTSPAPVLLICYLTEPLTISVINITLDLICALLSKHCYVIVRLIGYLTMLGQSCISTAVLFTHYLGYCYRINMSKIAIP